MIVYVSYESLLSEIRQKSHLEVQHIQDPEVRYLAEAGTEKDDELGRCVVVADAQLRALVSRYLTNDPHRVVEAGVDTPKVLPYPFLFSRRRAMNKAEQLPQMMRDYLVNAALAKFYATVAVTDLAASRGNMAAQQAAEIVRVLYTKLPPLGDFSEDFNEDFYI